MLLESRRDKVIKYFVGILLVIICAIEVYPLIFVISMSFSSMDAVLGMKVRLLPIGFTYDSYKLVLTDMKVWNSYFNTAWYVIVGTVLNIIMTLITAYPLTRKNFFLRNKFMAFMLITMYFSGGLIPFFLLIKSLGLYNTRWAIVLPAALSVWNVIITRTFIQNEIPESLIESAKIDGYNDIKILFLIVAPLSKVIIAIIALYSAVGFWNSYFSALIFLPDKKLKPLQVFLMELLLQQQDTNMESAESVIRKIFYRAQIKYVAIVVSILPIMLAYPFLQKYFVKGVMIGAVKE